MTLRDFLVSVIRTAVPSLVGLALVWIATKTGVSIPAEPISTIVTGLVGAGYYAAVRLAEARWSWVGWLLGYAVAPTYSQPAAPIEADLGDAA